MGDKKKKGKLRILMLNYEFPPLGGGASPVSYEIAKGYVKLGHSVDVVTMGYKDLPEFETKEGVNIYRVKCLRSKKEICHPWEQLSYLISAKKFLRKHLKTHKYDINHTHFIIPTGVLSLWIKKKFDIPYIITSHGSDVLGYNKRFKKLYPLLVKPWKKIIKNANFTTTPSKYLQDEIKKITTQGKFIVIPNGIDKTKFKPLKKEKRILIVARLFENKGVQDILDALKSINMQDWKVDIVGEGPYRDFLENKMNENGLSDVVKFHGWIDNKSNRIKELYGKASIFISASYFENMSIVLLEALASGCKTLASNIGGNPEVIENKEDLFEVKNVNELRKNIKNAMSSEAKSVELNKKFNWDNVVRVYVGVLR
jgi:glycosyltransferase involved in cell wall biosynthesis